MGCSLSLPSRAVRHENPLMKDNTQYPPHLTLTDSRLHSFSNDSQKSSSHTDSTENYSVTSMRDWKDFVSFQTFMNQNEKPQIFEYEFVRSIGRGAQAEVYLVRNTESSTFYAAKVYDKAFLYRNHLGDNERPIQKTVREIQIMSTLSHDNCMGLIEVLDDDYTNSIIIVQPFAENGPLLPQRAKTKPLIESLAKHYFFQIALGVQHIHSHGIVHRDIKPENIMLFRNGKVAIGDFSASVFLDQSNGILEDTDGTPAFYSPEQCSGKPYLGKPTDVWACGVTLYLLLYGELPFFDVSEEGFFLSQFFRIASQIQNDEVRFIEAIEVSQEAKDLVLHCLDKDATTRYTIDQVVEHPWFNDIR